MRGSVSVCLYKGRQIEKTCVNFFEESGLIATLKISLKLNGAKLFCIGMDLLRPISFR